MKLRLEKKKAWTEITLLQVEAYRRKAETGVRLVKEEGLYIDNASPNI